jgi:hypothetical protein
MASQLGVEERLVSPECRLQISKPITRGTPQEDLGAASRLASLTRLEVQEGAGDAVPDSGWHERLQGGDGLSVIAHEVPGPWVV